MNHHTMKGPLFIFFLHLPLLFYTDKLCAQKTLRHFIFFSNNRELIHVASFFNNNGIAGAQISYPWKKLEKQKGVYDFSAIEEDLLFLSSKGKKLFIQIQDVTFDSAFIAVPTYILTDTIYHGGAYPQFDVDSSGNPHNAGWMARRWDKNVADRFHALLIKLSLQFDGRIEGINLPETAVDIIEKPGLYPPGFSPHIYLEAIKANMYILKTYFEKSVPIQYANFMPGDSKKDLEEIYSYAKQIHLGMGGPDLKVYKQFQMENSYPLIRNMNGAAVTGVAVQEGNYDVINPTTGKKVTIQEILDFATNYLRLDYLFWCTEEPFYSKQVLPLLLAKQK